MRKQLHLTDLFADFHRRSDVTESAKQEPVSSKEIHIKIGAVIR